jgi:hypothetical protein
MSSKNVWDAVLAETQDICNAEGFARIVDRCPYFEQWWSVELTKRFADSRNGYRLVGFEPRAASLVDHESRWYPDLLLDKPGVGNNPAEVVWVELKQINLCRNVPKNALSSICRGYRKSWRRAKNIDSVGTVASFYASNCAQNLTLLAEYRSKPENILNSATHLSAAFMLVTVPLGQAAAVRTRLETAVGGLGGKLEYEEVTVLPNLSSKGEPIRVCLLGIWDNSQWSGFSELGTLTSKPLPHA